MKLSENPALCRTLGGDRWWLAENTECDRCFGIAVLHSFAGAGTGITTTHKDRECPECDNLGAHVKIEELSYARVRVLLRKLDPTSTPRQKVSDNE